jgi:hypothetical protein
MSRTLKRVPLDFEWPLTKIWGGFLNPYYALSTECPDCEHGHDRAGGRPDANAALFRAQWYGNAPFDPVAYGAGPLSIDHPAIRALAERNVGAAPDYYMTSQERSKRTEFRRGVMEGFPHDEPLVPFPRFDREAAIQRESRRLHGMWIGQWCHHLIQADVDALIAADRLWDFTSTWSKDHGWQKRADGYHPTAAEVNMWSLGGMGHDSFNASICTKARCAREGVPHSCSRCKGSGRIWPTPEIEQKSWKKTEPPAGDGYQLWEDCSEGSPISPVFPSLDDRQQHLHVR